MPEKRTRSQKDVFSFYLICYNCFMKYLQQCFLPNGGAEYDFLYRQKRTCNDSFYPFRIFPAKGLDQLALSDITILCGGNGSGKTTLLNIMAEKLGAERIAPFNRSEFFGDYLGCCEAETAPVPEKAVIITSDDVFDYMLDVRVMNEGIMVRRQERYEEWFKARRCGQKEKLKSIDEVDELRKRNLIRKNTLSQYVRKTVTDDIREFSNGESAFRYFTNHITENGIFFLDEPENSLSPKLQQELVQFLQDSVRFYNCQLILSTHSPFLLSMRDALIYDLDQAPVRARDWHELENVRIFFDFFKAHESEF